MNRDETELREELYVRLRQIADLTTDNEALTKENASLKAELDQADQEERRLQALIKTLSRRDT